MDLDLYGLVDRLWTVCRGFHRADLTRPHNPRICLGRFGGADAVFGDLVRGVGGIGLFDALRGSGDLLATTSTNVERVTFGLLDRLSLQSLTTVATIVAAFLFIVTSVVSAAIVLGTFSTGDDPNPSPRIRLIWGGLLGAMGWILFRKPRHHGDTGSDRTGQDE